MTGDKAAFTGGTCSQHCLSHSTCRCQVHLHGPTCYMPVTCTYSPYCCPFTWKVRTALQVEDLARLSFKRTPLYVGIDDQGSTSTREGLEQGYCVVPSAQRFLLLFTFLKKNLNKKVRMVPSHAMWLGKPFMPRQAVKKQLGVLHIPWRATVGQGKAVMCCKQGGCDYSSFPACLVVPFTSSCIMWARSTGSALRCQCFSHLLQLHSMSSLCTHAEPCATHVPDLGVRMQVMVTCV